MTRRLHIPTPAPLRILPRLAAFLARYPRFYRWQLRWRGAATRPSRVPAPWMNTTLKTKADWRRAVECTRRAGLHPHPDPPKNWDAMGSLDLILDRTDTSARILDAGGEVYSPLVEWLYLWGYRSLHVINLVFTKPFARGSIQYEPGDCTDTKYAGESFDVIVSLSVIEHGVALPAFLWESRRILRPGGLLIVSTDYWPEPIDTSGHMEYGAAVRVFTRTDIEEFIRTAHSHGFRLTGPVDLTAEEEAVVWERLSLRFTFLLLAFERL